MKTKLFLIAILLISVNSFSQTEFYQSTKNEIYDSISTLSISLNNKSSEKSVFFAIDLIVENPELDYCADIKSNEKINKSILKVIEEFKIWAEIYVEGEDGITGIRSGKIVDLDNYALQIYMYYDAKKTMGTVYLGIKNKTVAKKFIKELIKKIGYRSCLNKLKRKIT